jgi:muconolactone D-isomerase
VLYHVRMDVHPPANLPPAEFDALKLAEREIAQRLQREGAWVHLWRIAGQYSNVSVFDVPDHDALHALLSGLPLFPFMTVAVTPLARHPSAIAAGA